MVLLDIIIGLIGLIGLIGFVSFGVILFIGLLLFLID